MEDRVVLTATLSVATTSLPDPVFAGAPLTLKEVITNTGTSTATAVTMTDTLPANLAFISASGPSGSTFTESSGLVNGTLGDLAAGATDTVFIQATPTATGPYTNMASASATNAATVSGTFSGTAAPAPANAPSLSLVLDGPHGMVSPGQSFGYLITVTDTSHTNDSTGTVLTDILPAGVTLLSITPPAGAVVTQSGNTITFQLDTIPATGADATTLLVTPNTSAIGQALTDVAIVTSSLGNATPGSGTGSNTFTVGGAGSGAANLVVTESGTSPVVVGQNITYTYTVTNAGSTTATATTLIDTLPSSETFVSAQGPAGSETTNSGNVVTSSLGNIPAHSSMQVTIVATPNVAGQITNSGTVTTTAGVTNTNTTTGSFTATVNPASTTTTVAVAPTTSVVGQAVTFTATVTPVSPGAGTPTGTVSFMQGSTLLGTASLGSNGQASANLAFPSAGNNLPVTAVYAGDGNFSTSTSSAVSQTVNAAATTTTAVSAPSSSAVGQSVLFTATVTVSSPGAGTPTGTVTFEEGTTVIGTGTVGSNGQATANITFTTLGQHLVTAVYSGSANFTGSTAAPVTQLVGTTTTTTLGASPNPAVLAQPVVLTATVTPTSGVITPTGTVTFLEGATTLGTASLNPSGQATFTISTLALGANVITASYAGDSNYVPSTSTTLTVTVQTPTGGLQGFGLPVHEAQGIAKTSAVVNFNDTRGVQLAGNYTASINWGDGTAASVGVVILTGTFSTGGGSGGSYQISGTHTYAAEGTYTITVTIVNGALSIAPTATATVGGFVTQLYHDLLNRLPDPGGLAFWVGLLSSGKLTRQQVVGGFWGSVEHRTIQVTNLYETILHRAPDAAGLNIWVNQLTSGTLAENTIELDFLGSGEYQASHASNDAYIAGLYHDILGRAAAASEIAIWTTQLASGAKSRADVASLFIGSVEASLDAINFFYNDLLGRPADPQGLQNWLATAQSGVPVQVIEVMFLDSDEYNNHALAQAAK